MESILSLITYRQYSLLWANLDILYGERFVMGVHIMKGVVLSYILLIGVKGIMCDYYFIMISFGCVNMASE